MTKKIVETMEEDTCPMCGSGDLSYKVHTKPPSREIWHCRKCSYEWYHFYDTD